MAVRTISLGRKLLLNKSYHRLLERPLRVKSGPNRRTDLTTASPSVADVIAGNVGYAPLSGRAGWSPLLASSGHIGAL